jgi:hypothetical protein
MVRGVRYYNGRQMLLSGRHIGLDAREDAVAQAKRLRASGHWARIIKVHQYDYMVYSLLNEIIS